VVALVLALVLVGNGLSSGPTTSSGGVFGGSSDADRRADATRRAFHPRKRFDDAPAEYDDAAWEREKARRAADGRDPS
jgi:hypothetical protein